MKREKERDTIFLCWLFHLSSSTCGPSRKQMAWPRRALNVNRLLRTLKLKISAHASGAWRHLPPPVLFLHGLSILTSLNDTSSPHAREHLRSCLHLTKQCTERKVLILTKPKGKIYKTKSLRYYITQINESWLVYKCYQQSKCLQIIYVLRGFGIK